jgi:hypothetical protein
MDTEPLEKELQIWNRFMYIALASSITLVVISFGNFIEGGWQGFARYVGGLWPWLQLTVTPPGFYLLWSKRWKSTPVPEKKATIIGFLVASWFSLLSLGLITINNALVDFSFFIIGLGALIVLGNIWVVKKKLNQPDEMFP